MNLDIDFDLVRSQKLVLTPQMKQILDVLRMNSYELFRYVEEQMETNPVLEMDDGDVWSLREGLFNTSELPEEKEIGRNCRAQRFTEDETAEDSDDMEIDRGISEMSLKDYLLLQLHMEGLSKNQTMIGEYLIDNIDENGYLASGVSEIAAYFHIPSCKVEKVLSVIQGFDPPGIGARNLKECLLIQMKQRGKVDGKTARIILNYLNELANNRISSIARQTSLSCEKIRKIADLIKSLEPKPGREFWGGNAGMKCPVCDVIVRKTGNKFEISANENAYPVIKISEFYRKIEQEETNAETKSFIQGRINCALWLIECIEQRKIIIRNITGYIVEALPDFFEKGRKYTSPVLLESLSDRMKIHESIIRNVVTGKYLQCRWGAFELRSFVAGQP